MITKCKYFEEGIPEPPKLCDFETKCQVESKIEETNTNLCTPDLVNKNENVFVQSEKETSKKENISEYVESGSLKACQTTVLHNDRNISCSSDDTTKNFKILKDACHYPNEVQLLQNQLKKNVCSDSDWIGNVDLHKYHFTLKIQELILPFSDEQLKNYYYNEELEKSNRYMENLIFLETKNQSFKEEDDYFFKLLKNYAQTRYNLKKVQENVEKIKKKIDTSISTMWTLQDDVKITEKKCCDDGNLVSFEQKYFKAQFNSNAYDEFNHLLKEYKYLAFEIVLEDLFASSFLKFKIEYYLQSLITSCSEFSNINDSSPVTLYKNDQNTFFQKCLNEMKKTISTLFFFQKKQEFNVDVCFVEEIREWISDLVSILIRISNWEDHLFIISHIMSCCGGVGDWAAHFIQLPHSNFFEDPFDNFQINHIMTVMNIILNPIHNKRNLCTEETEITDLWTVVDSDGEIEDESEGKLLLKENDLVSILNQIPFSELFKIIFGNMKNGANDFISSDHILKLIAFSTDFIRILFKGLKFYCRQKYKQFTKRLGRLICHTVCYVTEVFVLFKSQKNLEEIEFGRAQAEYDNFFFRSAKFIYSTKKLGTWQFLVSMPFQMVSLPTIMKLYSIFQLNELQDEYTLNINFSNFEEKFLLLPEEEQCYILATFANMAVARNISEIEFIKNVVLQLFYIGFVSVNTIDFCYKNVQHLLKTICLTHPQLISEILKMQCNVFSTNPLYNERRILHLWLNLPLEYWMPNNFDFEILSLWIMEPSQSLKYEIVRIILQSLNYGIDQGKLFMAPESHREIAFILMQASIKLVNENEFGFIKNVSYMVLPQNYDHGGHDWIWATLLKLRLHLLDKTEATLYKYFNGLEEHLKQIPDVDSNSDLHHFVMKNQPVACFVALMTTTLGHSVPIICDKGFDLIEVLLAEGKYNHGIACLEFITLLFLECPNSLFECKKFLSILSQIIAADNTLAQLAKNLIMNNFPGQILKNLNSMIQNQLKTCKGIQFQKFSECVQLWLHSLTKLPSWSQEPGVVYILDNLLQNVYFDFTTTKIVLSILENLMEENKKTNESKSSLSYLMEMMNLKFITSSLSLKEINGDVPWLSYSIIQIQFEKFEKKNSLWLELLKEINSTIDKKTDIDYSLKKVCNFLGIPVRPSSTLSIYKWTHQILNTDISHPLIPLFWQKFFYLFFYRVSDVTDRGSLGDKFFDGIFNQRLFMQLKNRLEDSLQYFKDLCKKNETEKENRFVKLYELFQSFSFWINDTSLLKPNINTYILPPKYNPELLGLIIHGSETPWIDFIDYFKIEENFKSSTLQWLKIKNRKVFENNNKNSYQKPGKSDYVKSEERFNSYETPLPPPLINKKKYSFSRITPSILMNSKNMVTFNKPFVEKLFEFEELNNFLDNEYTSVVKQTLDVLPHLYTIITTEKKLKCCCDGINKSVNGKIIRYSCTGPAVLNIKYEESKINEKIEREFDQSKKLLYENLNKIANFSPPYLSISTGYVDIAIEELVKEYQSAKNKNMDELINGFKKTGIETFYEFIQILHKNKVRTPLLKQIFERFIDVLGKNFIENNSTETGRLLQIILSGGDILAEKLIKYFSPNTSSLDDYIVYYSYVLESAYPKKYLILSKFDFNKFLFDNKPKFSARSRLISLIKIGLISASREFNENKNLLKVLNENLEVLLNYDFPEHYGEILNFLLEASQNQTLCKSTWYTFLNSLTDGKILQRNNITSCNYNENKFSIKHLKQYFIQCAGDQKISLDIVQGTINVLASNFKNERSKSTCHGLYRKYQEYFEPLITFFGMLSYSCIAKTVEIDRGSLSEKLTQQLWPLICELYSPWLIPYHNVENEGESIKSTDNNNYEKTICWPWSINDMNSASICATIFSESIKFILETLPGFNNVLRYVWFFYANNFGHVHVKDHVLNVIHESFLILPWETFHPNLQDVESMLKVVDSFSPFMPHTFVENIFIKIKWNEIVQSHLKLQDDDEMSTKIHICLLNLFVKIPVSPIFKQDERVINLLKSANDYSWHFVDSRHFENVLNYFVKTCDPRIVLSDDKSDNKLEVAILGLLQSCAGYVPFNKQFHPTTLTKKVFFIRAWVKLLTNSNRKFQTKNFQPLLKKNLWELWDVMISFNDETTIVFGEFFNVLNEPELSSVVINIFKEWLSSRKSLISIFAVLRSPGTWLENPDLYGNITEFSLEIYFDHTAKEEKKHLKLEDLLLYLTEIKFCEKSEPKIILLISFLLNMLEKEMKWDEKEGLCLLSKLHELLFTFTEEKGTGLFMLISLCVCSGLEIYSKKNHIELQMREQIKALQIIESAENNKIYNDLNQYVSHAKTRLSELTTIEGIIEFLKDFGFKLFNKNYLT
ncbi:conserved hypothetical protein [Pediculus humanus corporis]|uniref:Ectopic P granules protein n=1 Tax=Pediculus humanus subsp. corporis TaxID=121224 RepID=E0VB36_PEDHC|nr:uncharacterized protein Phum_PHUM050900 [Pediculus humanus corporis]EEB10592.1 conserved hypothetical protein [Pediculus humanus corporis]